MSSRKTIPPLLEPYLRLPPEASLLLLTGVLNATPHWLTVRVLRSAYGDSAALSNTRNARQNQEEELNNSTSNGEDVAVVLVSWLRDWEFWKGEARRGAGLDLPRLAQENKFAFVDGLTSLFSAPATPPPTPPSSSVVQSPSSPLGRAPPQSSPRGLPVRGGPLPSRGAPLQQSSQPQQQQKETTTTKPPQKNLFTLTSPALSHAEQTITTAINSLTSSSSSSPSTKRGVLLILDSPTTPLFLSPLTSPFPQPSSSSSSSSPSSPPTNATSLQSLLLTLRSLPQVHSTTISLETDTPFISPSTLSLQTSHHDTTASGPPADIVTKTPLENEVAGFVAGVAHQAKWIIGVRGLDTGVARDVSGVVRVSRGGSFDDDDDDDDDDSRDHNEGGNGNADHEKKEMEVLYFVQSDGGVKVFERGGGQIG